MRKHFEISVGQTCSRRCPSCGADGADRNSGALRYVRPLLLLVALLVCIPAMLVGCGKISGPRFWWDDRNQARVAEGYQLPIDPAADADYGVTRPTDVSGGDLTEDNLRDYRTNLDQEEEKRKSEASLVDF